MRILLIEQLRSSSFSYKPFEKLFLTMFSILPTLYVRRLAALTPKNHQVTLINERYKKVPFSKEFDVVVIHFTTASAYNAYETADRFRRLDVNVVLCGLHASALPLEGLEHADSILIGRGEANWITLLKDLEHNSLKDRYLPEPYETVTETIPPTRVDLPGFQIIGGIEATRGCPYHCRFCPESNTPYGNHFYKRPVDDVVKEIKNIPQKIIMFYDASLTIDPDYTKELFKKMIPLKKKFFCNGNVDALSENQDLLKLGRKAGCIGWLIGFESISQQTINHVNKKTNNVSVYKRVIDNIHNENMMVIGDFMFGFDTDTKEVFKNTVDIIIELGIDVADFTIATPFPGTPFYDELNSQQRIITNDWKKYTMYSVVFEPKNMSKQDLIKGMTYVYKRFYSPSNTMKRILRSIRFGIYPFFSILNRNIISFLASTKIRKE